MSVETRKNRMSSDELLGTLQTIMGADRVLTDQTARTLYAQDVYTKAEPALAVLKPSSAETLAKAVKATTEAGIAIVPRGGGMSYTSGYVPAEADSVVVDMSALNTIIEINETDMYVTVEAGVTWRQLYEALNPKGLRTPFWGTLSGSYATVGGGLSQNSVFWGSGKAGTAADSVIGLQVVLADGRIIETGMAGHKDGTPFYHAYGPNITGLFVADAGALGFKTKVTLRLVPAARAKAFGSFAFDTGQQLLKAMSQIGREEIATESFAFDPFLQSQRLMRESLSDDVKKLTGVIKGQGSLMKGLKEGAKVALAGRGYVDQEKYTLNVTTEGRNQPSADADMARVREICADATEIENSIPKIMSGTPFGPVNSMLGPQGQRWVPIHVLLPHSKVVPVFEELEGLKVKHADLIARHKVETGYLMVSISTNVFIIEPVFFWPDAWTEIHETYVDDSHLKNLTRFDADEEARKAVELLRQEMLDIFEAAGAAHLQIGKTYRYSKTLKPEGRAIIDALKSAVDPDKRVNPGALGI